MNHAETYTSAAKLIEWLSGKPKFANACILAKIRSATSPVIWFAAIPA